jgi:hypothetical protein
MPTWLIVVLVVLGSLIVLLAIGGLIANAAKWRRDEESLHEEVEHADRALAEAHAQDRGWERTTLENAARAAFEEQHPGTPVSELVLVQVIDPAGTDEDKAVFRVVSALGESRLTLGRRGGAWHRE